MKKLIYLIVLIVALSLIVAGCTNSVVPPAEQSKAAKGAIWQVPGDFATIKDAINSSSVLDGDTIMVGPGEHVGALVTKAVEIKGAGGAVINDGPAHSSGLIQGFRILSGGAGATISHFTFEVDLAIMAGDPVNDVTIEHNVFNEPIQGISNWRGSGWIISHNEIINLRTRNGGGIGILIGDYTGITVNDNLVSHNKITGTLYVDPNDGGGYNGSGIVLYADFRGGSSGAEEIAYNRVVQNKISLTSDNSGLVDVIAIELTDSRDDPTNDCVIFDNAIGFNDLRGTELQFAFTPEELEDCNEISRNLGDNRGHGLSPSVFK